MMGRNAPGPITVPITLEVTLRVPDINVRTPEVATTITQQQLRELPTITRDPYDLIAVAGNVNDTQDHEISGSEASRGANGFSINGLRSTSTNVLLDGAANNDEFFASVGQPVPLDAVQEFSVITSNSFNAIKYLCNFFYGFSLTKFIRHVINVNFNFCVSIILVSRKLALIILRFILNHFS